MMMIVDMDGDEMRIHHHGHHITVKEEGKERGGEAVREDRGVVVAVHLDPRVAVVRRHNPEMGMIKVVTAMGT